MKTMNRKIKFVLSLMVLSFLHISIGATDNTEPLVNSKGEGFILSASGKSSPFLISSEDFPGVIRAFKDLQTDIEKVTGAKPDFLFRKPSKTGAIVIAGTLGKSDLIDRLVKSGKLDVTKVRGQWETFSIQVISKPFPKVKEALVIVGSDKRGTIYGIYELSASIGVSPWYWWADVPVEHKDALYVNRDVIVQGPPSVKYRGIFLNDEYPNLTRWITAKFGTVKPSVNPPVHEGIANYNRDFYTKLFELMLRLKGNYLWPAMWNNAFNEDDTLNPKLADEYGIVMGTSHQEPMIRAQKEWDRRYKQTLGSWNYTRHEDVLHAFWREGIKRNRYFESIITMGLRGADDTEMGPGGPEANMKKLEKIVEEQRRIIAEEMNPDVTKVPQMWCLYKEVQEYYTKGLRVPDDITLLWAEDNWGNIRRVPSSDERKRSGGAGIYYHFDYHGGPRSYQWINTSPLPKIWDQLTFAKQYGADRIWIVNVGHFKAYSLPMQYFLDLGWYGDSLRADNIRAYTRAWSVQQFGEAFADETAEILAQYTRFNSRRKPELLSPSTYSLIDYAEAETVVLEYNTIAAKAEEIYNRLPQEKRDAYYQLVLFPTRASALVNELYLAAAKNNLYAKQQRASTNEWAEETQRLFRNDTSLMGYFNTIFAGGKWKHFMDQAHLGYTSWNDPPVNSLRHIDLKTYEPPDTSIMGVSLEGSELCWPDNQNVAVLPEFDVFNKQTRFIDIFNKGLNPFDFEITADPWIVMGESKGKIQNEKRIPVSINWEKVPKGRSKGSIAITGSGNKVEVVVTAFKPDNLNPGQLEGFVETNGYVSIEVGHFLKNTSVGENRWLPVEDFGHTLSGMRATSGVNSPAHTPGKDSPCVEYGMFLFSEGEAEVIVYVAPTLNFLPGRPVRYAVAFDDSEPQMITMVPADFDAMNGNRDWEKTVSDNYRITISKHTIGDPGYHTLKIWMVDPGVVLQKIVVNTGGVKPSYLGPPESFYGVIGD
jgi:hypothetical protein